MPEHNIKLNLKWRFMRVYIREASLKLHDAPALFEKTWQASVDLNFHASRHEIGPMQFEAILGVKLKCTNHNKLALEMSVEQAAIVRLSNDLADHEINEVLAVEAPNALFPYLREAVDNLALKASVPPFQLANLDLGRVMQEGIEQLGLQRSVEETARQARSSKDELLN